MFYYQAAYQAEQGGSLAHESGFVKEMTKV